MAKKRNNDWVQDYFFLFIPNLLEDELLTSWLTRMAIEHRRTLPQFINFFIRHDGCATTRTDIDFQYNEKLLCSISQKSKFDKRQILQMSLRSEEGYLFLCDSNNLYPPLQIRKLIDKRTHNGLMYCPKCLAEDKIPYFRKKWRYSFYNACTKHNIFLTDRCWRCYEKVNLAKIKHFKELCFCCKCEKDFRENITVSVQSNYNYGIKAIKWFEKGLTKGYFKINKQKIRAVFVFESFRFIRYLINVAVEVKLKGFPLMNEYQDICRKLKKYNSKKALSIKKEFILTSMVFYVFQKFPNNLIDFAKQNGFTYRDFTHGFKYIPFWYIEMIFEVISKENKLGRVINEKEVVGAIKYLKSQGKTVNQFNVAEIVGCSFTVHKGFVKIYKSLTK